MLSYAVLAVFAAASALAAPAAAPAPANNGLQHLQASRRDVVTRAEIRKKFGKRAAASTTPGDCGTKFGSFILQTDYRPGGNSGQGQFLKLDNPNNEDNTAIMVAAGSQGATVWTLGQDCTMQLANRFGTGFTTYAADQSHNIFNGNTASQLFTTGGGAAGTTTPTCKINGDILTCSAPDLGPDVNTFAVYSNPSGQTGDALVLTNAKGTSTYGFITTTLYVIQMP